MRIIGNEGGNAGTIIIKLRWPFHEVLKTLKYYSKKTLIRHIIKKNPNII